MEISSKDRLPTSSPYHLLDNESKDVDTQEGKGDGRGDEGLEHVAAFGKW